MLTPYKPKRLRGRKRAILSLFAAFSGLLSWQHLEGIGLGDRPERALSSGAKLKPSKDDSAEARRS